MHDLVNISTYLNFSYVDLISQVSLMLNNVFHNNLQVYSNNACHFNGLSRDQKRTREAPSGKIKKNFYECYMHKVKRAKC